MTKHNSYETSEYTLPDLSAEELKVLIDNFPDGDDEEYGFLTALLDEYSRRPESPQVDTDAAKQRCMESLGLTEKAKRSPWLPRRSIRIAAVAVAAVILLAGSTLAIGLHTSFFRNIFGLSASGQTVEQVPSSEWSYTDPSGMVYTKILPAYQLTEMDETQADDLLGPYVKTLDQIFTVGDYTVALLNYIEDEAGTYRIYYSVENPNGLENIESHEINGRVLISYAEAGPRVLIGPQLVYADIERSTETKIYLCAPGVIMPWMTDGIPVHIDSGSGTDEQTNLVMADALVPTITLENEEIRVSVSPMGAKILSLIHLEKIPVTTQENLEIFPGYSVGEFVILLDDGTEFVVCQGSNINNSICTVGRGDDENSITYCFDRLIDPESVVSVTVDGTVISRG